MFRGLISKYLKFTYKKATLKRKEVFVMAVSLT